MKDIKDVLLYLDSFDENNMFDFEHNNKLYYVSEVLRSEMSDRIKKFNLNYCEDDILDLIDLTVKITDMINLKKPNVLQEIKKLYNGVLQYENENDTEFDNAPIQKIDSLIDDSIRDCHHKYFHTFDHICEYDLNFTNITNNEIVNFTISDKSLNLYELKKN